MREAVTTRTSGASVLQRSALLPFTCVRTFQTPLVPATTTMSFWWTIVVIRKGLFRTFQDPSGEAGRLRCRSDRDRGRPSRALSAKAGRRLESAKKGTTETLGPTNRRIQLDGTSSRSTLQSGLSLKGEAALFMPIYEHELSQKFKMYLISIEKLARLTLRAVFFSTRFGR